MNPFDFHLMTLRLEIFKKQLFGTLASKKEKEAKELIRQILKDFGKRT